MSMSDKEAFAARCEAFAKQAVGRRMKVILQPDKHPGRSKAARTIEGPIVECCFHREVVRASGRSAYALWKVVIEAGVSKTRHVVYVNSLPTRNG